MTWRDRETDRVLRQLRAEGPGARAAERGPEKGADGRLLGLDALRGWSLVWMMAVHAALVGGVSWFPRGVGFMVFIVVAGSLYRRRLGRRYAQIVLAGILSIPPAAGVGLNDFNILLAWGIVLPLAWLIDRWRVPVIVTAVIAVQLVWWWPLGGSNPGIVLLGWLIGLHAGPALVAKAGEHVPTPRWLLWIARHPLTFYVGHLWLLYALVLQRSPVLFIASGS